MPESEKQAPDPQSKTQAKKDMLELQKLGESLISLPEAQLAKIPLPDELREAIRFAKTLKAREGRRRHLQYIGKIMREIDCEQIRTAMKAIKFVNDQNAAKFHQVEKWREKLITDGDEALQELLEAYPQGDRQQLRQVIRKAVQDRRNEKNTGGETALFRALQKLLAK